MFNKFPSLAQPEKFGYTVNSNEYFGEGQVSPEFRMFETMNDGMTQHSPDWPITTDFFPDFLFSLSAAMLADIELVSELRFKFNNVPDAKAIEFAASVVFKNARVEGDGRDWDREKKTRYFSVAERKITTNDEKRHDKRYEEVKPWCNGSVDAIYRIICPEHRNGLQCYIVATAVSEFAQRSKSLYMNSPAEFLGWTSQLPTDQDPRQWASRLTDAFRVCTAIIEAHSLSDYAFRSLESEKRRIERIAEAAHSAALSDSAETPALMEVA